MKAVRSAARMQPLAPAAPRAGASKRLQEGAVDTILNSVSILGDVLEDFRSSDRFFKYKAMVLGLWALLMIGAFGVACPPSASGNDLDATLVVSADGPRTVYMVKNESTDTWEDVEIVVNGGAWRSTMSQMAAKGGYSTLSAAVLFDDKGNRAPSTLIIKDIVVRVREPEAEVTLLRDGLVVP